MHCSPISSGPENNAEERIRPCSVNIFDFQKYLSGVYVEQEVVEELLGGKKIEAMTLEEIDALPFMDFQLDRLAFPARSGKDVGQPFLPFLRQNILKAACPTVCKRRLGKEILSSRLQSQAHAHLLGTKKDFANHRR